MTNENYNLQQYFLDTIVEFARSNPNSPINSNFVYSNLIRFNIKNMQFPGADIKHFHDIWLKRYDSNPNLLVADRIQGSFLWFLNGKIKGNEIKIYVPMDYLHIQEGANQLFDFVASTNIEHQSKIASIVRNDNVVLRVNSMEDAKKIVDFVSNNEYIKDGLIAINPFLPNYNGIGITMDNNYTYNGTISDIIASFITKLRDENRLNLATVENLNMFIKEQKANIGELDLKDIYELLDKITSKEFDFQQFLDHADNKLIDKYTKDRERITDPSFYFEQAVIETSKKKYDFTVADSIRHALTRNPDGFTRTNRARDGVLKYVHPGDIINIMRTKLSENNVSIPTTDEELISKYVELVVPKVETKLDLFEIIQTAYRNTLKVYDLNQAYTAIINLVLNNNIEYFTNRFNDRSLLKQHVLGQDVKKIILNGINLENLDDNNMNEIISRFCDTVNDLEQEKQY